MSNTDTMDSRRDQIRADPDIQAALRGNYGKWGALASQLPAAWPPNIRNQVIAQSIASEKGYDTSGLDASNNFETTDSNTVPNVVKGGMIGVGALAGLGAAGAFGGTGAGLAGGGEAGGLAGAEAAGEAGGLTGATAGTTAGVTAGTTGGGLTGTLANTLISKGIPAIATALGGAAKGEQQQNNTETNQQLSQEQIQLNRDKYALDAPNTRLATAIKASIASNFQPQHTAWGGPGSGLKGQTPTITGGLSGSLANLDPRTKELANQIMLDELTGQRQGGPTGGGQDRALPKLNQTTTADKVLGGASLGTSILGSVLGATKGRGGNTAPGYTPAQPGNGYETVGTGYEPVGPNMPDVGSGLSDDDLYQMMMQGNI